ncbi:ABC transporter ATP-binding protein [Paenibacillus melissococcoides]|uniref:ABC transporter ATP-binding protein n=1 Tax=Paenibacillus melissococcoides TaxID=2912268 RepID=A0ABN8TZ52_9BACL|nr:MULTISPECIES: ABC transporter ATP-binding protein [Paenibacillus]MEB9893375.1 ABC transporter ATP-binding protein [Bacillus cereus]CAH8244079.1 ABC transporter ATP-binding protein [Paenibacillus melissococcoides]CAH8703904.1 ABC transporter ATP-binding protein [Paenibacillus melissococcoides]CAH8706515.1 ABC transporter ATP-binding protein [Paenibacillus melissococcoides]GIO79706.1 ABC transporter ATP-binding protein [Paenibacillus dendritiformis]
MKNVIAVHQVSKRYGKKAILSDVDMTVAEGEIYGLIGPSGAGKTTLVKLIVGMDSASQGAIEVEGVRIPNLGMLQRIGYMAQSDALYPELTGEENLDFFASLFGLSKKKRSVRIAYAADLVQLTPHLSKKVMAYSGGMKRRLSLAIALVHDPQVLVLDEPTVGIDPELRLSIWNELYRLKQEGKSILVTTHVMDEAEKCDRLAMMREGRMLTYGSPAELKSRFGIHSLEEIFIKAGGMDA